MTQPRGDIFHQDFQAMPHWWEAYRPATGEPIDVPRTTRVAVIGGSNATCGFELEEFPDFPMYNGTPTGRCPPSALGIASATASIARWRVRFHINDTSTGVEASKR